LSSSISFALINRTHVFRAFLAVFSGCVFLSSRGVAQRELTDASIVLRPGDLVRVTVWRKPELSGDFLVAADSALKHPLYREFRIAGMTVAAARGRIVMYLSTLENSPQVSIEPLFRVAVGGEVRIPNLYTLSPETSIAQAVALAGGPSDRGRIDRVRLLREGRETLIDLTATSGFGVNASVASGDQIIVGRRTMVFRDYIVPTVLVLGSLASISSLFVRR
jgi:protein involved in polysaccharide export with SLBB domain